MDKRQRLEYLISEINKHNKNYYELDNPSISDAEYDKLYYELVDLEKELDLHLPSSPTQKVGGDVLPGFSKKVHEVRLYSLNKVRSKEELNDWINEMHRFDPTTDFSLEYKFDGLQLVLIYENGLFVSATTRGNGIIGEDVTMQVKTIRSVPLEIPFKDRLIVQGEGMMTRSSFKRYNKYAEEPLKNERNGVAGAVRNLDPKETAKRGLDFFCYSILSCKTKSFKTQQEMHEFLQKNGFKTGDYFKIVSNIDEIEAELNRIDKIKKELDILIDGMVLKMNNVSHREDVGYTNKFPKWAMAFKFEAEELSTTLKDVVWQVGRTGKVTPTAVLEPVELAGAVVKRATLNNIDDIRRKKLSINSKVFVRRSNEVIPEILGLAEKADNAIEIGEPEVCPCCKSVLRKDGPFVYCDNYFNCKDQVVARLVHFASRDAMNIEGLNEKTIADLYEKIGICVVSQFFKLDKDDLVKLEHFKEKRALKVIEAINKAKKPEFYRFIFSLGILEVGVNTARSLAEEFENLDDLKNASMEEILKVRDVGEVVAKNIYDFFRQNKNSIEIYRLLDAGVEIQYKKTPKLKDTLLSGKKVVITGTLENLTRQEASEKVRMLGGRVISKVSPYTNFVIVGKEPGSKYQVATELNIPIISDEEFKELLKEHKLID